MSFKTQLQQIAGEREALVERVKYIKAAQAETFENRLREARAKFHQIAKPSDLESAEQHIFIMAENLCVANWEIPPHWKFWLKCEFCGPMPSSYESDKPVVACPWCHSHPPKFDRFEIADMKQVGIDLSKSENIGVRDAFNKAVADLDEAF